MKKCCINKIKAANQSAVQPWMRKMGKQVAYFPDDAREEGKSEGRGSSQNETWEERTCSGKCTIQQRKQQTGQGKLKIFYIFSNLISRNQLRNFCCHFWIYNSQE